MYTDNIPIPSLANIGGKSPAWNGCFSSDGLKWLPVFGKGLSSVPTWQSPFSWMWNPWNLVSWPFWLESGIPVI